MTMGINLPYNYRSLKTIDLLRTCMKTLKLEQRFSPKTLAWTNVRRLL